MIQSMKAILGFFGVSRLLFPKFRGAWNLINPSLSSSSFFEATWGLSNKLSFSKSFNEEAPVICNADWLISINLPSLL